MIIIPQKVYKFNVIRIKLPMVFFIKLEQIISQFVWKYKKPRISDAILPYPKSHSGNGHQGEDLSRDDLLFLLSILEGELQVSWLKSIALTLPGEGCL